MGDSSLFFQGLETETKRGKDLCGERNWWSVVLLGTFDFDCGQQRGWVSRGDFNLSCFAFSLVGLFCVEVAFFAGPSPFIFCVLSVFSVCCVAFFSFSRVDFKRLQMVDFFYYTGQVWFVINSCRFGPSFWFRKVSNLLQWFSPIRFANQITDFYTAKLDKQLWPTFFNFQIYRTSIIITVWMNFEYWSCQILKLREIIFLFLIFRVIYDVFLYCSYCST